MNLYLFRYKEIPNLCTRGVLIADGEVFHTIEPPWNHNMRNTSCIPSGIYDYEFLPRSASGKYRNCYHIKNVIGRDGILIHNGNLPEHTKGCILIGQKCGELACKPAVLSSKVAMSTLNEIAESGKLKVVSWIG